MHSGVIDIRLIQSRVAEKVRSQPKPNQPRFRNISIITSWNSYRDKMNALGVE